MSGKLLVFVSSVQKELEDERRAVRDFIEGDALLRRFFDVFLFEDLPASGRRPDELYLAEVERSAIYLGLFGNEYGYEDAAGVSPTEQEFDRATATGKERLVFIKGTDDKARHPKMRALIRKASDQLNRRRFGSISELTALLYASLVEYLVANGSVHTRPFDASACPGATLDDISSEKLADFLERAQRSRGYALGPDTTIRKALAHLNLLDGERPSNAAILLFGKEPQRFLITSEVKCLHFHGTEVRKPIPSYQIYRGTVFELVDQGVDFVMSKVNRTVGTRSEGPMAPVTYELPRDAVAEAIVNAVAHRDYASNASVQVMLFSDRLEVWNPGHLPPTLTPDLLRVPHASIPHNPLLADPLFLTRYIEKAGTGTLDRIALCQEAGLTPPAFRQDGGQFVQTLWRPAAVTTEVTTEVRHVLEAIRGEMTRRELQDAMSLKNDEHFRKAYLVPAVEAGVIEMTIPDKPNSRLQKYRITSKGKAWLARKKS
jgi:ATP-dependent DNA helicase RecG